MAITKDQIVDFINEKVKEGSADVKALVARFAVDANNNGIPDIQENIKNFFTAENLKAKGTAALDFVHEKFDGVMNSEAVTKVKDMVKEMLDKD